MVERTILVRHVGRERTASDEGSDGEVRYVESSDGSIMIVCELSDGCLPISRSITDLRNPDTSSSSMGSDTASCSHDRPHTVSNSISVASSLLEKDLLLHIRKYVDVHHIICWSCGLPVRKFEVVFENQGGKKQFHHRTRIPSSWARKPSVPP